MLRKNRSRRLSRGKKQQEIQSCDYCNYTVVVDKYGKPEWVKFSCKLAWNTTPLLVQPSIKIKN